MRDTVNPYTFTLEEYELHKIKSFFLLFFIFCFGSILWSYQFLYKDTLYNLNDFIPLLIVKWDDLDIFAKTFLISFLTVPLLLQLSIGRFVFFPPKPKYRFTNFDYSFHPFYGIEKQAHFWILHGFVIVLIISFSVIVFSLMGSGKLLFVYSILVFYLFNYCTNRSSEIERFPSFALEFKRSLNYLTDHYDYKKAGVSRDLSYMFKGYIFKVSVNKNVNNDLPTSEIQILDEYKPGQFAIVSKIYSKNLADTLRLDGEGALIAKLISIDQHGKLEIELSLDRKINNSVL